MKNISASVLRDWLITDRPPLVVDVREPWETALCRIEGSLTVPMSGLPASLPQLSAGGPLVMVCHHGMRSAQVGAWLERSGRADIFNLSGGIDAWAREVDPEMQTY